MSIDAFDHIYLEDTCVLAWHEGPETLTFYVVASLLQTHPEASPPATGHWACYRPCIIQFTSVTSVQGLLRQDSIIPATDAEGSVDFGYIDSLAFAQPNEYRIAGDFGDVLVVADRVSVYLAAAA